MTPSTYQAAAPTIDRAHARKKALSVLVIGDGWFPDRRGGLNRYVRDLHATSAPSLEVRAIVVGPVADGPTSTITVGSDADPLPIRLAQTTAAVRRAARTADVIDCHFPLYAALPLAVGALGDKPLVVHFHGPWEAESRAAGESSGRRLRAKRRVERFVFARAARFVVLSHAFKSMLTEDYDLSPDRIDVIPPGVDLASFSPVPQKAARARLSVASDRRLTVAVRRLVPRVGLDALLNAWNLLQQRSAAPGDLVVIGDGPERDRLERRTRELGIADTVRFVGAVEELELTDWYNAADVSVLPSLTLEGFGLAALESLACGTPVIGTDSGGLPELLRPLDASLVVPRGDVEALAQRLEAPVPSRQQCRAYAETFTWARAIEQHDETYRRAVADRGAAYLT